MSNKVSVVLLDIDLSFDIEWNLNFAPQLGDYIDILSLMPEDDKNKLSTLPLSKQVTQEEFLGVVEFIQYFIWVVDNRSWSNNGLTIICKKIDPLV